MKTISKLQEFFFKRDITNVLRWMSLLLFVLPFLLLGFSNEAFSRATAWILTAAICIWAQPFSFLPLKNVATHIRWMAGIAASLVLFAEISSLYTYHWDFYSKMNNADLAFVRPILLICVSGIALVITCIFQGASKITMKHR